MPSNFKMRLSEYKYSPSAAVQGLSKQLSQPISKAAEKQKPTKDLTRPAPAITKQKLQPNHSGDRSAASENKPPLHGQVHSQLEAVPVSRSAPVSRSESLRTAPIAQQVPALPTQQLQPPAVVDASPLPGAVVKQGIVKLLFKLKKNNHHGYIAPHDGSKDIIFHQKYVGPEVFSQLERGMEVEVTAHITEGKAYADQIRIL